MKKSAFKEFYKDLKVITSSVTEARNSKIYQKVIKKNKDGILPYLFEELKKENSPLLLSLLTDIIKEKVPKELNLDEERKFWLNWFEENKFSIYQDKDVVFNYSDNSKFLSGHVNEISDSDKYIRISNEWYETEKLTILDTFDSIREEYEGEEVVDEDHEKLLDEENKKLQITNDLRGKTILYRMVNSNSILQCFVENISPNCYYIQLNGEWKRSKEILILEILENRLEKNKYISDS